MKNYAFFVLVLFSTKLYAQCTPAPITITAFGTACPNSSYTLHVDINYDPSLTYEWQRNSVVVITGTTNIAYPYDGNTLVQGDVITCIKTNGTTGCKDTANYTVNYKDGFTLSLSANPSGAVAPGTSVTFTASQFTTTLASTFVFYVNGVNVYSVYNGGPNNTYTSSTLSNSDIVYSTVQHSPVSNPCGTKDTSNSIIATINGVLPILISGFFINTSNNVFLLDWSTASETNSAFFNVQTSSNGINFTTVGKVDASGNSSSVKQYYFSFQPHSVSAITNYFRLQMVDKDGSVSYSSIQKASLNTLVNVMVSPNPATNSIYVSGINIKQLQVLDMSGKILYQQNEIQNNNLIDVSKFSRGMYLLRLENSTGNIQVQKIVLH